MLRVKLTMDGEYIVHAEPVLGYIHRMHEKLAEAGTFAQFMPNTARMDYLHALAFNHGWALVVEKAAGIEVPERAEYIRVITVELNRIASHLLWWAAFLLDLGGFTPLLYAFDDREQIIDLLERVTGSRLTYCYMRFGGVYNDIDDEFITGTRAFIQRLRGRLPRIYHDLVTHNIILIKRIKDIGFVSAEQCRRYGATGPVARGSGISYDVLQERTLLRSTRNSISTSRSSPRGTPWPATWCACTRSSSPCASSSRPWTSCPAAR